MLKKLKAVMLAVGGFVLLDWLSSITVPLIAGIVANIVTIGVTTWQYIEGHWLAASLLTVGIVISIAGLAAVSKWS